MCKVYYLKAVNKMEGYKIVSLVNDFMKIKSLSVTQRGIYISITSPHLMRKVMIGCCFHSVTSVRKKRPRHVVIFMSIPERSGDYEKENNAHRIDYCCLQYGNFCIM